MKKANIKIENEVYEKFILIENMSDMIAFRHEKTYGLMKESARILVDKKSGKNIEYSNNIIVPATEAIYKYKPKGIIYLQAEIMGKYQNDQDEIILDGKKIAINPYNMVSYFAIPSNAEIDIISEKQQYSKDDIKLSRWPNGIHWYAKISQIDVVMNNEYKWNSKKIAREKAEEFLKEL